MSQEPPSQQPTPKPELPAKNSFQAVVKAKTVDVLRGTIRVLEGTIQKLEAEPAPTTEGSWLDKLQAGWSATLAKMRSLLPQNLSSKLSDTTLTAILAGTAVVLVWATSAIAFSKPTQVADVPSPEPTQVAKAPSPEPQPPQVVDVPSLEPELPQVVETPSPEPEPPQVAETPSPEPEPVIIPSIPTPPELTAPAEPQPVEVIPPPKPEPTPEQTLIATIENQIAAISDRANGLIQSIQVNFEGSSLTIQIGNNWYNLKPSEQDDLAAKMFQQARDLDFTRLEITDPQGTRLARSPIVGKDMVILKRS